ncbi:NADH dehydrogenase 1 alpha subcomplex subunit 6 [Mucidula mucida]|nr:NADH dehydrogenase 1 alpha subcomplex subunit 6 [Mucidula mucida]
MAATAYTIPARLARPATISKSPAEQRQRVIQLYREWYRSAPSIVGVYGLSVSPAYVRHAIRQQFEHNRHVTDTRAIDVLLLKSRQEYQECLNVWKLPDHVMDMLSRPYQTPRKTFLQKFYQGRDEEGIRPAASGVV